MNSAEDTTQTGSSSREDAALRVSRRDVLLTGTAGAGLLAVPGASSAAPDDAADPENDGLLINVIGFEIDGPLDDCIVEYGSERKTTDESGNVVLEVSGDSPEITLKKDGWENKTETIARSETGQEVYVPMYVANTIDP